MSMQTPSDISLVIIVPSSPTDPLSSPPLVRAERRITPSWTLTELKSKLEPVTGIPSTCQSLHTLNLSSQLTPLSPDSALIGDSRFNLGRNSELFVIDTRPPGARVNLTDVSGVEKYVMPTTEYEKLDDSVLAWKKRQKLGRFDPAAKPLEELVVERREKDSAEVEAKGVRAGLRCRVNGSDERRGVVRFVGEIEGLGGDREKGCVWVGVEFDEPVGRNDGSVEVEVVKDGKRERESKKVFETRGKGYGGVVRPQVVEVGEQFGILDDLVGSDMEEI